MRFADELALRIDGLMCLPPQDEPAGAHFVLLGKLAAQLGLDTLSMGMSAILKWRWHWARRIFASVQPFAQETDSLAFDPAMAICGRFGVQQTAWSHGLSAMQPRWGGNCFSPNAGKSHCPRPFRAVHHSCPIRKTRHRS